MLTTVAAGRVFDYSHCIGMYAMAGQGFWAPQDFVFGADGIIYVISRGQEEIGQRISKVSLDHEFWASSAALAPEMASSSGPGPLTWTRTRTCTHRMKIYIALPSSIKKGPS